jgi:hypothetical protein
MNMGSRTRLWVGLAVVALLGGSVEALALPTAISVLMRGSVETRVHPYVAHQSKYVSPEWGSDLHRHIGSFPQHFHGYVVGRLGF